MAQNNMRAGPYTPVAGAANPFANDEAAIRDAARAADEAAARIAAEEKARADFHKTMLRSIALDGKIAGIDVEKLIKDFEDQQKTQA